MLLSLNATQSHTPAPTPIGYHATQELYTARINATATLRGHMGGAQDLVFLATTSSMIPKNGAHSNSLITRLLVTHDANMSLVLATTNQYGNF